MKENLDEWETRVDALMEQVHDRSRCTLEQLRDLFNLNNEAARRFGWPAEYSRHCSSCVERVHNRLKRHWTDVILPKKGA